MTCIFNVLHIYDIVLLSTSLSALQSTLNICESFAEAMNIKYNCKQRMVIRIAFPCKYDCEPLQLCGVNLLFLNQSKYFGIYICSANHFKLVYVNCKLKFYRCFTSNLRQTKGHNYKIVCVELLKRYCIQIVLCATVAVYPDKQV